MTVLGKLPVPGRPTIWITVGQGPTALAVGAGWGLFGHFYSHLSFQTEILSQRAVKPKTTKQPIFGGFRCSVPLFIVIRLIY